MKSLLAGLLVIAALSGPAYAASTDTASVIAMSDYAVSAPVAVAPVEQKVVELHITETPSPIAAPDARKRRLAPKIENFPGHATCSGEFVSSLGDIITAKHCTDMAGDIEVVTYDGRHYAATIVASSTVHDLALIHIDRRNTAYFDLATTLSRGETVFILGSPLSISDTLTTGIVAKLDGDMTFLDCAALPGNSGGPVYNKSGELVGVLTAGMIVMMGTTHLNVAQGLDAVSYFLRDAFKDEYGR